MLKREDLSSAKKIVNALLRGDKGKVAVCYLRLTKRTKNTSDAESKETAYLWKRVVSSSRDKCWSWQVVLVDKKQQHLLPNTIPVWEDDARNGSRSMINFERAGVNLELTQADLPLVSRMIGEPIERKRLKNTIRCWYIKRGEFIPSNKEFSRSLIALRCKIKEMQTGYSELFRMSKEQLLEKGFEEKEIEIISRFKELSTVKKYQ